MADQVTLFEYPLNERIRVFLRLEHLIAKVEYFLPIAEEWATRAAVEGFLGIYTIVSHTDIANEVLLELRDCSTSLEQLMQKADVDTQASIQHVQEDITSFMVKMKHYRQESSNTRLLRDEEFIKLIQQRISIPGSTCAFDLPHYGYWLKRPYSQRAIRITEWMQELLPIRESITYILSLIRGSRTPQEVVASSGLYVYIPENKTSGHPNKAPHSVQMVRIELESTISLFPEVSGNSHRFNIRFMEFKDTTVPIQTAREVRFRLTRCYV